jgi:hypothetical protein
VRRFYGGPPNNWTDAEIEVNIYQRYDRGISRFSAYDPTSIMHYPIPNELTLGDFEVGWNTVLSATDTQYAGILYPRPAPPPPPPGKFDPPAPGTPERAIWDRGFNACYCAYVDPLNGGCR